MGKGIGGAVSSTLVNLVTTIGVRLRLTGATIDMRLIRIKI